LGGYYLPFEIVAFDLIGLCGFFAGCGDPLLDFALFFLLLKMPKLNRFLLFGGVFYIGVFFLVCSFIASYFISYGVISSTFSSSVTTSSLCNS